MVPMNYICDMFGWTITTEEPKEEASDKIPYQYEFNTDGNLEGWSKSGVAFAQVKDGMVYMKSISSVK